MTPKQKDGFDFIRARLERDGIAPSYEEITSELKLSSKSGAVRIVDALVEQGKLVKRPYRARGLALARVDLASVPTPDLVAELEKRGLVRG